MYNKIMEAIKTLGAYAVAEILVADIEFVPEFREMCISNACGKYGTTWNCPPYVGEADALIAKAKTYKNAIVYQTVSPLEDSFDIEGMQKACEEHHLLSHKVTTLAKKELDCSFLNLGAGGCFICQRCAVLDKKPCYFPEKRIDSIDTYCIHVLKMAEKSGLKYINGENTVTYFSALLVNGD